MSAWNMGDARDLAFRVTRALRLTGAYTPKLLETIQPVMLVADPMQPGFSLLSNRSWSYIFGGNSLDLGAILWSDTGGFVIDGCLISGQAGALVNTGSVLFHLGDPTGGPWTPSNPPRMTDPPSRVGLTDYAPLSAEVNVPRIALGQSILFWYYQTIANGNGYSSGYIPLRIHCARGTRFGLNVLQAQTYNFTVQLFGRLT